MLFKVKQFNSRIYSLDFVKDNDEFEFLMNTLGSFQDTGIIKELATLRTESNRATIHVETNNRTLKKYLLKMGFEQA